MENVCCISLRLGTTLKPRTHPEDALGAVSLRVQVYSAPHQTTNKLAPRDWSQVPECTRIRHIPPPIGIQNAPPVIVVIPFRAGFQLSRLTKVPIQVILTTRAKSGHSGKLHHRKNDRDGRVLRYATKKFQSSRINAPNRTEGQFSPFLLRVSCR